MSTASRLAHHPHVELQEEGYCVHCGTRDDGSELTGRVRFTHQKRPQLSTRSLVIWENEATT